MEKGTPGETYNIGAGAQVSDLDLTRRILTIMGQDESMIEYVEDRLGHDRRYAVDSTKTRELGWAPMHAIEQRLAETVEWYRTRRDWWEPLRVNP